MAEQLKLNKKVLQQNDDCINLQQLTTKEIIKTILSSEKPIPHIQQQLQQSKLKQYKQLKYTKANLDFDLIHKENEELKKYNQTDYIYENFQSQDAFDSLNEGNHQVYFNKYKSQPSQQDVAFSDRQFQQYQMKQINKNKNQNHLTQNDGITINYISQPSVNYKGEDNRYNFVTQNFDSEHYKEHNFQQNLFQQSKQIQEQNEISQYKPIKNNQINLELIQNNANFNPNTSVQPHNAFLRKNSRMHIIRRSLVDILNTNSRLPSPQDCESHFKRLNSNFESLKHSLSQCEISQTGVDNKIFDSSFLSQHYNQNMNDNISNSIIRNSRQFNRSSHQNPLSKSMINSQKSSLQDLLNKKKQEKCNQIFLGFNNILLHKNKVEQRIFNKNEIIEPNLSKQNSQNSQEQISQQNLNKKDLSLSKKMPLIRLRSNSQHSSRFYSKTSRLNNEISSQEASNRKERNQHLEYKQQISAQNQNQNLNHNEARLSQSNLHENTLYLKEIQFPNNNFHQKQQIFKKKRSNSQEKPTKSIDLLKLVPNQKEETDKLKQNKMIQQFLQHMREQNQSQNNQSSRNGIISNLISQNSQPKIVSTFQYQPIQSINVTKYNEFKLNKKRRAFSIQNCQFVENQNLQELQQQEQNQNKVINNKYYQALLEQYDPQSIQILKNKIIANENREDKGFDLNTFLYSKYINFIKNPIVNKNHNEIKSQQMKNIRKTYSLKNNDQLQRTTSIKKSSTQSPQLVFKMQEDVEKNINFSGWDDTFDLNKRDDLENYLRESNKRDWVF
ncbi:hypothetical protein TTHERM_00673290 (macronuclear) [Tetrahymena thermophila SB210]|uniref:Uncharacterized protein n=1 Tax=Tetrahymena thermophila (strain SB210) TaxID=312017 RepID=Q23E25_TETTS|nr:hypothetical protein TTHERM_00673290 [Tetrahymena thermophila SB210]EAR94762.1 hypothetical protein TTHERM_00673290 [Tetrahymena thermophila SB210]|eukprot:XP_001015007.1 hypothetical protein TTHERM_00673290 [Tetrahymena thermophila SB210]